MLSQNQPLETEIGTRSGYFTFWMRSTVATTYRPVLHRRPKARNPTANRMLFVFSMFSDMFDDLLWFSLMFWLFCRPSHIGGIPGFLGVLLPLFAPLRYRSCERLIYSGLKIYIPARGAFSVAGK